MRRLRAAFGVLGPIEDRIAAREDLLDATNNSAQNANGTTQLRSPLSSARTISPVKASNVDHYGTSAISTVVDGQVMARGW
jgi:hypothetical protein